MAIIRFDTDGWHARVGEGFDESHVVRLVDALARAWLRSRDNTTVIVGYDTRRDSRPLAIRAAEALAAVGLRPVVSDRPCSAPALCRAALRDLTCVGALMLTASGASYEQGGLITFRPDGGPVSAAFAEAIEQDIKGSPSVARGAYELIDIVTPYKDAVVRLTQEVTKDFPKPERAPRIVVDAMYGTAVGCAGDVFRSCGYDVIDLHNQIVPDFRGLHPDVCEPWVDQCERAVVEHGADLGVVIDGDGRHAAIVDARGRLMSRHDIAPLVMRALAQGEKRGRVVSTYATSVRVEHQAEQLGLEHTKVPVGFEAIYREFSEEDVMMAADALGGVSVPTHLPERDGLLAACVACAQIVALGGVEQALNEQETHLGQHYWGARMVRLEPSAVQRLYNLLPGINPGELDGMVPDSISHGDGLWVGLPDDSWLLIRSARSQLGARVVAEASSSSQLTRLLQRGCDFVRDNATPHI